jgi:hypothetical protein
MPAACKTAAKMLKSSEIVAKPVAKNAPLIGTLANLAGHWTARVMFQKTKKPLERG